MTRQTLQQQVETFTQQRPLSIAHPLQCYLGSGSYSNLPRHPKMHWRGLLQPKTGAVHGQWLMDERLLPAVPASGRRSEFVCYNEAVLCHCKPIDDHWEPVGSENRYPDIPDRWDLYLLLTRQYNAIAFTGKTQAAIIHRTEATYRTILKLRDWESDPAGGLYRRTRVKSQLRRRLRRIPYAHEIERAHAKTALTHLGLKLPAKPNDRLKNWHKSIEQLGLTVEIATVVEPVKYRARSNKMIKEYRERYPDREL